MSSKPRWFRHLISIIAIVDLSVTAGILACVVFHYFTPATGAQHELQISAAIRTLSDIVFMLINATMRKLAVIVPSTRLVLHPVTWKLLGGLYVAVVPIILLTYTSQSTFQYNYCGHFPTMSTDIAMSLFLVKVNAIWVVYIGYRLIRHYGEEDCIAYGAVYPAGIAEVRYGGHNNLDNPGINHDAVQSKPRQTSEDQQAGETLHLHNPNNVNDDILVRQRATNPPSLASLDRLPISESMAMTALLMSSACLTFVWAYGNAYAYDIQAIAFSSVVGSTAWLLVLLYLPIEESVNDHQNEPNFAEGTTKTTTPAPVWTLKSFSKTYGFQI